MARMFGKLIGDPEKEKKDPPKDKAAATAGPAEEPKKRVVEVQRFNPGSGEFRPVAGGRKEEYAATRDVEITAPRPKPEVDARGIDTNTKPIVGTAPPPVNHPDRRKFDKSVKRDLARTAQSKPTTQYWDVYIDGYGVIPVLHRAGMPRRFESKEALHKWEQENKDKEIITMDVPSNRQ